MDIWLRDWLTYLNISLIITIDTATYFFFSTLSFYNLKVTIKIIAIVFRIFIIN